MPPKEASAAPAPAKTGGAARFSFGGGAPKCKTCAKSVYENEKIVYDQVVYHQECFKCKKCTNRIPLVNVAMISGDLYCKPCFKKIFAEKGTYSSFGDKTTPKWSAEEAKKKEVEPAAAPAKAAPSKGAGVATIAEEPKVEVKVAATPEPAPAVAEPEPAPAAAAEPAPAAEAAPAEAAAAPAAEEPAAAPAAEAAPEAAPAAEAAPAEPAPEAAPAEAS